MLPASYHSLSSHRSWPPANLLDQVAILSKRNEVDRPINRSSNDKDGTGLIDHKANLVGGIDTRIAPKPSRLQKAVDEGCPNEKQVVLVVTSIGRNIDPIDVFPKGVRLRLLGIELGGPNPLNHIFKGHARFCVGGNGVEEPQKDKQE